MNSMAIDRRRFLQGSAAMSLGPCALSWPVRAGDGGFAPAAFASAVRRGSGFALLLLSEDGSLLREIPLEARGHDTTVHHEAGIGVMFARRPGDFAVAFELARASPPQVFRTPADRHFYGHGVFSQEGRLLYATENDFENARGLIGVYDVKAGFSRVGEFPSGGVGPHDLHLLPDGRTLVVANGGIETHPDAGRAKLNVSEMRPSLAFIDREDGRLLARHELGWDFHKLSIRHLDVDHSGKVWFGGQWEGSLDEAPDLLGTASLDQPLKLLEMQAALPARLKGYIGSVSLDRSGRLLAASAPRAGRVLYFDTATEKLVSQSHIVDGCGVAPRGVSGFAISSGGGELRAAAPGSDDVGLAVHHNTAFDNHMISFAS